MQKQNPIWISEFWNFILQVPANVLDTQDRENQMQKKKIYTKTYCDASKKAIEAFQTILLQVNFFFPHVLSNRRKNFVCGHWHDCPMWNVELHNSNTKKEMHKQAIF